MAWSKDILYPSDFQKERKYCNAGSITCQELHIHYQRKISFFLYLSLCEINLHIYITFTCRELHMPGRLRPQRGQQSHLEWHLPEKKLGLVFRWLVENLSPHNPCSRELPPPSLDPGELCCRSHQRLACKTVLSPKLACETVLSPKSCGHWSQLATPPAPSPWASPVSLSISSAAS